MEAAVPLPMLKEDFTAQSVSENGEAGAFCSSAQTKKGLAQNEGYKAMPFLQTKLFLMHHGHSEEEEDF